MLIGCSITYAFIAWFVPKTYSTDLDVTLEQNVKAFISDLQNVDAVNSRTLFDEFQLNNDVLLQFFDASNDTVALPSQYNDDFISGKKVVGIAVENSNPEAYRATNSYMFSFANSKEVYTLTVAGNAESVNQLINTLSGILPWLVLVILFISILGAIIYSRYVTNPVINISRVSEKMSNLDFGWCCDEERTDELGLLSCSLNTLSKKLSSALAEVTEANRQLQADIDYEKRLEQARLDFFSAVSHELKTPITIIKGQLEGMRLNVGKYKDRDKYLSRSLEVANILENMVQELLTVSRIESSGIVLQAVDFNFSDMVKGQYAVFEDMIIQKDLSWQENIEANLMVHGDKLLLKRVLDNLISNAIHYSSEGNNIYLATKAINDEIQFRIENTGVHIPEENIVKLFDAFYRVDQSRNRQSGGSGLGLYIVKMILDKHNASYKAENTELGVRFTISFK